MTFINIRLFLPNEYSKFDTKSDFPFLVISLIDSIILLQCVEEKFDNTFTFKDNIIKNHNYDIFFDSFKLEKVIQTRKSHFNTALEQSEYKKVLKF